MITDIDLKRMVRQLRASAKKRNIDFSLTEGQLQELSFPLRCPLLGTVINYSAKGYDKNMPSVDRIENDKGYHFDNIMIVSFAGNRSKSNLSESELKKFASFFIK